MSRSLAYMLECTKCKNKFSSVIFLEPSDRNCICWDCHCSQQAAKSSSSKAGPSNAATSQVNGAEQMEAEVASTSSAAEPEGDEATNQSSKLCGILKKIKDKASPPDPRPSGSNDTSRRSNNKKMTTHKIFLKKGMHLPKRGSNHFVCPDCSAPGGPNGGPGLDLELIAQLSMLQIRPVDDDRDEGVEEDEEVVVDGPEQEVPQHGEYLNHENFFVRHPQLLGEAMAAFEGGANPPRRHTGQCGHRASSFIARCHVCRRKFDISSPASDLLGCLICYFRDNMNSKRNRSPRDYYG